MDMSGASKTGTLKGFVECVIGATAVVACSVGSGVDAEYEGCHGNDEFKSTHEAQTVWALGAGPGGWSSKGGSRGREAETRDDVSSVKNKKKKKSKLEGSEKLSRLIRSPLRTQTC